MSGIVGIYRPSGDEVDRHDLREQLETLAHRGPDGAGLWRDGHVGLGHQRLLTTPEARGEEQPIANGKDLAITADLRLDNREELIGELGLAKGSTDAELLLAAYDRWGDRSPEQLVGAFAFAIWDGPEERLFLARDHLGVKPLYYHWGELGFVFGTEPKAVLSVPGVPTRLDENRVGDHLIGLHDDTERTFYRDVKRLQPAHSVSVGPDGLHRRRYWALDATKTIRLPSDQAYADAFREHFTTAVRDRLRSPNPVGTLLSGGLDSSSIACTARRLLDDDQPLHTVSATFDSVPEADERDYIDAVLASEDFVAHSIAADEVSPLVDLDSLLHHHDEPSGAPNHFMHWALYREADAQGIRVLLDGIDGDTTVSHGRGYMADLVSRGRWIQAAHELGEFAEHFDRPKRQVLFNRVLAPLAPRPVRWLWRLIHGQSGALETVNPTVDAAFAERVGLEARIRNHRHDGRLTATEHHHRELTSGLIPFTFESVDRAAAAFAIEPRFPFFDKRLVEFCLALPTDQKIRRGWTRWVLRNAMDGILPEAIQWRGDKSDLSPNFRRALIHHEGDRLAELFEKDPAGLGNFVDLATLRSAFERYRESPQSDEIDIMSLWYAASLAVWLRRIELG